jgi:N-dimethylarginine dimethylaminohydrolase
MNSDTKVNSQGGQIRVRNASETAPILTVVMRLTAPYAVNSDVLGSLLDPGILRQLRHNHWGVYEVCRAQAQQLALVRTFEEHGARVILEPPLRGSSSAHYTRDIGFAIDETYFVARMGTKYRLPEVDAMDPVVRRFSNVVRLESGRIEGGDVMLAPGRVLVGLGEASDVEGIAALRTALAKIGSPREVIPLHFRVPGVIHLDTKFNLVAPNIAIICRSSFEPESLQWLEKNFELIDATPEETKRIQINTFGLGNGRVIMDQSARRLADELVRHGLEPVLLDYSEISTLPGSFRCTTLPIERANEG